MAENAPLGRESLFFSSNVGILSYNDPFSDSVSSNALTNSDLNTVFLDILSRLLFELDLSAV